MSRRRSQPLGLGLVALVVAGTAVVTSPSANAATTYTAPLRTAVRALPVAAESNAGYNRDLYFGRWGDANRDCQDTRSEVLVQESRVTATGGCKINYGRWSSYFDNRTYTSATSVQIDHLVPVAEAWGSGARTWTQARRVAFYNDLGDRRALNAMTSALNSSKGARGPEQWMPPYAAARCRYISDWAAIKHRWSLKVDSVERAALIRWADSCPNVTITVVRP